MDGYDVAQCTTEIAAYLHGAQTGYPLLINTENLDFHREIMSRLDLTAEAQTHRISGLCHGDALPDIDMLLDRLSGGGNHIVIGLAQFLMLNSYAALLQQIRKLISMNIHGRMIVLLFHCEHILLQLEKKDPRLDRRILLVRGQPSALPRISLVGRSKPYSSSAVCKGMHGLLTKLESLSSEQWNKNPVVSIETSFGPGLFEHAMYHVEDGNDIFAQLQRSFPETSGLERAYGTDEQWTFLFEQLKTAKSLAAVITQRFGSTNYLSSKIGEVAQANDPVQMWLLWLGLKLYGAKDAPYLQLALMDSNSVSDLHERLIMTLLSVSFENSGFAAMYLSRKRLLETMPENLPLISQYCQRSGKHEKNAVYYLTDQSEEEAYAFLRCMSIYDYTEKELLAISDLAFPELHRYLLPFHFTEANMLLPNSATGLREEITKYFQDYKQQKLTNRIWPSHMETVLRYAEERPYNMLQARSTLAAKVNKKGAQLFFFDAFGVEYLSYLVSKCEQYGMIAEISVGVCQLPSITSENKDFISFFPGEAKKIGELDEVKHHSQIYDYQRCKEPIHLFRELEIIDEQLRQIRSRLIQGVFDRAVIVSDHGASRLAVINNSFSSSTIRLDERAGHSGRCCRAEEDPQLPFAAYTPSGYAVLANYERFQGGRRANVEVHGGATLEEVLVPVITLALRPSQIEIAFVENLIQFKGKEPISVTVFANIVLSEPILVVNVNGIERSYHGEFVGDHRHARFVLDGIKRSRKYSAIFFDGAKLLASDLVFTVQKGTRENASMGI